MESCFRAAPVFMVNRRTLVLPSFELLTFGISLWMRARIHLAQPIVHGQQRHSAHTLSLESKWPVNAGEAIQITDALDAFKATGQRLNKRVPDVCLQFQI